MTAPAFDTRAAYVEARREVRAICHANRACHSGQVGRAMIFAAIDSESGKMRFSVSSYSSGIGAQEDADAIASLRAEVAKLLNRAAAYSARAAKFRLYRRDDLKACRRLIDRARKMRLALVECCQ